VAAVVLIALVAVGNALKAAGMSLKANGMNQKMKGEQESKSGKTMEKTGEKMTQKARKSVEEGHTQLNNLRTQKAEQESLLTKPNPKEGQTKTGITNEAGLFDQQDGLNDPKKLAPWTMQNQPSNHNIHSLMGWSGTA